MNHGRFDAKRRHNDESEIIVCRYVNAIARRAGEFFCHTGVACFFAVGIDRLAHDRRREIISFFL